MSITASDIRCATETALRSNAEPADILEALCVINRKLIALEAQERNAAMACGRRGDTAPKVNGLTDTQTSLLRRFAACGVVRYADMGDLHRHKSALCKALKRLAPSVRISTLIGEGYEITAGFDEVYRLLHQGKTPSLRASIFTVKQTSILKLIALRGAIHIDQIKCLQRHISNVRAKLKKLGCDKAIVIVTAGEGLYTMDEAGREAAQRILSGEIESIKPVRAVRLQAKSEPLRIAA